MPDEPSAIPLAEVLRAANELVAAGLIEDYALGGALAAIYYVEPFTTYDADIIFVASDKTLSAGIPAIYSHLQSKGWRVEREHLLFQDFPVQFLAGSGLTERSGSQCATNRIGRRAGQSFSARIHHRHRCKHWPA